MLRKALVVMAIGLLACGTVFRMFPALR